MFDFKTKDKAKAAEIVYEAAAKYAAYLHQQWVNIHGALGTLAARESPEVKPEQPAKEKASKVGRGAGKRVLSAETRSRMAEAQKKRWAARKGGESK